jgi:5-methylcytosine-specific restriction protein A
MAAKLRTSRPSIRTFDHRVVKPSPKAVDADYLRPEHKQWRAKVIAAASGRCQWVEYGARCDKAAPTHRMFADHIVELQDGGSPYDVTNGQCLCGQHHTLKTTRQRAHRLRGGV